MPSKYNLDVNIVNYLIAHKSTIAADSAMNDISFPRQSWGEGRFALGKISVCIAPPIPHHHDCWRQLSQTPSGDTLPTKPLEDPMDSPTPTEGPRSVTSSASCPGGNQSHQQDHFCVTCDNIWSAAIGRFLE